MNPRVRLPLQQFCVSAVASNQGKTILTTALLWHFRDSVRPFKIGPDFIDPQFHKQVCGTPSVNLDSFIMTEEQVSWIYDHYTDKDVSILEGVMGFYDGDNKGCSAYSVSKLLNIPTILILDGSGSYITISAVLKGLLEYKSDNTLKAVVLNNLSSSMHYQLIENQIKADHPQIEVLGWIQKKLPALSDTHLGLDLKDLSKIEQISREVLEHINLKKLKTVGVRPCGYPDKQNNPNLRATTRDCPYPFPPIKKIDEKLAIVNDQNFSFLYHDNLKFLEEQFREVVLIDSTKDETIPNDSDRVYICGGYVESKEAYRRIENSNNFRESLMKHSKSKTIYAECAGLLYLGRSVEEKAMSGILDVKFTLETRFNRLGYYYNEAGVKGHAFHYTKPTEQSLVKGFNILSKNMGGKGNVGSWSKGKVLGTYLHTMFRNNPKLINS